MKQFFHDQKGQLSMGRLLSFLLFINMVIMFNYKTIMSNDLGVNIANIIIWSFGIAIIGKGIGKFAEGKK
jgi:hypothetical protein